MKAFIKQVLITSRPFGWVIFWVSYLGGYLVSYQTFSLYHLINIVLLGPILSFPIYALNDIEDYPSDSLNPRKKYWFMGGVLLPKYWKRFRGLSNLCILLVLIIPLLFGNQLGFIFSLIGIFIGIGYSVPPLRFKRILGCDIATTVIGFACLFMIPVSYHFTSDKLIMVMPYLLFSCLMVFSWSILCLGLDYESDKKAKQITTLARMCNNMTFILSSLGYLASFAILNLQFKSSYSYLLCFCAFLLLLGLKYKSTKFLVTLMIIVTILSVISYSSLFFKFLIW